MLPGANTDLNVHSVNDVTTNISRPHPSFLVREPELFSNQMDTNLNNWLGRVKHFCKVVGLEGLLMAQYLGGLLRKAPFEQYNKLPENEQEDPEKIFQMLQTHFGLQGKISLYYSKLFNLKQGKEDALHTYYDKVLEYTNMLGITSELQCLQHFISGIRPSIRAILETHKLSSMQEALDLGCIIESRQS